MAKLAIASKSVNLLILNGITLLILSTCAIAGPTGYRDHSCVSYCKEAKKFHYETGNTYVYDYTADIRTLILEESSQHAGVILSTKVEIEPITSCEFKLQLRDLYLKDSGSEDADQNVQNNDYLLKELEKHSTRFAFQDGKVEHLCSNPDEPVWVTNIKRGILSMFQNTMEDLASESEITETDVNGKCRTQYTPSGAAWGGSDTLTKFKDLSTCTQRQNHITAIQSIPYSQNPTAKDTNLMSGNVECNQVIRNHKIERVQCQEEQKFKPFEDKNSGAKNLITQTLSLSTSYPTTASQKGEYEMKRKSLLFEIDGLTESTQNEIDNIVSLLDKLEQSNFPSVKAEAPVLFVELVETLRQTSEEGLRSILKTTQKPTTKKFLLDAIPLVNSAGSLTIMRDFFLSRQLTNDQVHSWLWSVTFIKYPTLSMLSALSPLLEKKPDSNVLFSVSSLINSYCTHVAADCRNEPLIQTALERIASPLEYNCKGPVDSTESREAVIALKSLGNTGIYPLPRIPENLPILQQCMMEQSNSLEIRLAAVEAHRRMPCSSFSNFPLLHLYADTKENTEIRIKAYLISMNCADLKTIETVKTVMHTEVVNQVGSFVWTHLTNLQETNRPDKKAIRSLISNEFLKNKFQTDARKFSRNYESSMFWDDLNAGAGLDGNIIFTEESFLPKSGMVNLTLQMFGESVNVLEFGGRVQAAESLLEPIFGPNGYFPDESMTDFLKNTRRKRDVGDNEIERLPSIYEQASTRLEKTPGGSFYARVFGHEVMYKSFEVRTESSIPDVVDESGKNWFNIKTILDNLSTGKKTEFTKSTILMDVSYSVPSSAGIPLSLRLKAAATVGLTAEGRFNVGKFIEKRELDVYGYLRPNTAVNIDASLTVRIGARNRYIRSGLSVRNALRSSTAVETQLTVNGHKQVKASFNLPQDRQDIFEASSKVLMIRAMGDQVLLQPLPGTPQIANEACTGSQFSELLGLKVCGEISLPQHFSLTPSSPALVVLYVEKTDTFKGYVMDYSFENDQSATKMDLVFDTPGSKINRRTALNFKKETAIGRFQTKVETPTKVFKAEGTYSQFHKSFDLTVLDEGERVLQLNSSIHKVGNKIEPSFNLIFFKRPLAELKGMIEIPSSNGDQQQATIDLVLKHLTQNPVRINGNFVSNGETNEATLGIESYYLTGNIRSQMRKRPGHWSTKSVLEYSWKHGEINTVDINAKLQKSQKGALSKLSTAASFIMSKYPDHSVELSWESQTSHGFCENSAKFTMGKSIYDAHTLFSRQSSRDHNEIRMQMSLANLRNDIDYHLEFSHKMNEQIISTRLIGKTSTEREFRGNFDYSTSNRPTLKRTLMANTTWPGTEYSFRAALQEKRKGEFEGEVSINLNKAKEMKGTVSYINKSNNLKLDHLLEFRARGFSSVPISGSLAFSATDKQSHIGCNIQLEGKKPYSSRLSTSVDYSHTRSSHKIEAKVTFNEKKYNGEITFGHIKSGTRHLTVDLHLDNHIFLDAKMAGMFPESMVASISLVPSKDKHPLNKLELKGTLDSQNLGLYLNYFGEKVSFTGGYGEGFVTAEALWFTDQRIMISLQAPSFSYSEASASIFVVTPLEGFRNISLYWDHIYHIGRLESKCSGSIEDKTALLQFNALTTSKEIAGKALVEITGVSGLEGELLVQKNDIGQIQNFHFSFNKGDRGVISADYLNRSDESSVRFDFRGCTALPEILFHWKSSDRHLSAMGLEWKLQKAPRYKLSLELEKRFNPNSYELSITTPWETLTEIQASMIVDEFSPLYKIEVNNKGDINLVPSKISVEIQGTTSAFYHKASTTWRSQETTISLQGGITSFYNTDLTGVLKIPKHIYQLNFFSKLQDGIYNSHVKTAFDANKSAGGLTLDMSSIPKKMTLTTWVSPTSEKRKEMTIKYDCSEDLKKFMLDINDELTPVMKLEGVLTASTYTFWRLQTSVRSSVMYIPSFTLESDHNMIDIDSIHHKTKITTTVTPLQVSFWSAREFALQVDIKNQDSVSGFVQYGNKTVDINGEMHRKPNGFDFQLQISPSAYNDVSVKAGYLITDKNISATGTLESNGEKIFETEIGASDSLGTYSSNVFLTSSITPTIDGQIIIDMERWIGEMFLKTDDLYVVHLKAKAQVQLMEGSLEITAKSSMFQIIKEITTELKYRIESTGLMADLTYVTHPSRKYHIFMNGVWKEEAKSLRLSSDGAFVSEVEILVEQLTRLKAYVSHNQRKLGEIHLDYEPQMTDFAWGTHTVHIKYIDSSGKSTDMSISLGVDPKRFNLDILTPFKSWTQIKAFGQLDLQSMTSKVIKLGLHKDQDQMETGLELKTFRRNGTTSISTEISVIGFSKLRKFLIDVVDMKNLTDQFSSEQPEKFAARVQWSSSGLILYLETPLEEWKHVSFSGNWELGRFPRHVDFSTKINDQAYEFRASANVRNGKGEGAVTFRTHETYQIRGEYDVTNNYAAGVNLTSPSGQWNFIGKLITDENSIQLEATTPFQGYEEMIGKASYELQSQNRQVATIEWTLNKKSQKIDVEIIKGKSIVTLKLRTPFNPWESLIVTVNYDSSYSNLKFKADRGDGKIVLITFMVDTKGTIAEMSNPASSNLELKIKTPFEGFEETQLSLNYDRSTSEQRAVVVYNRNKNQAEGQLDILYRNTKPLTLDIDARMASGTTTEYKAHAALSVGFFGKNTFSANVQANNTKHEVEAVLDISTTTSSTNLRTSLPFLKRVHGSLDFSEGTTIHGLWEGNKKRAEIKSSLVLKGGGRGTFNLSLASPIAGIKNIDIELKLNEISAKVIDAALSFQNEDYRWMAKVDGRYDQYNGAWKMQVNTPMENYQELMILLNHKWTLDEKEISCSVEKGSIKLFELETSLRPSGFQLSATSGIFEYPIAIHSSVKWGQQPLNIQMTLSGGDDDYKTNVELSIQGIISGMIHLRTSILPDINSRLAWKADGSFKEGNAWASITNPVIGTKSVRTLWRNEAWNHMKLEVWTRSNQDSEEKGGTIQYTLTSDNNSNKRFSAQFTFALTKGTDSVSSSIMIKLHPSKYEAEIDLQTPFKAFSKFEADGFIILESGILAKINSKYNDAHLASLDGSLELNPIKSVLKVNLNAPIICKPFQIQTMYDFMTARKNIQLFYKQANYVVNLKTDLLIPEASRKIEMNVDMSSNVPFAPIAVQGNLKGSYQGHANGISELTLIMESAQAGNWKLSAALRPTTSDFHLKVKLDTAEPFSIPSSTLEANWRGNLRQGIGSNLNVLLGDSEYKATLSLSSSQFRFDFNSGVEGFKVVSIEGIWQLETVNKQVEIKVGIDGQQYLAKSTTNFSLDKLNEPGNLIFTLTKEENQVGSLVLLLEDSGKVELSGSWRDHEIKLRGHIQGTNENRKWLESGTTELSFIVDGAEQINIHSDHHFKDNDYSINITAGSSRNLKVHFTKGSQSVVSSSFQWNSGGRIKLFVDLKPESMDVSFSSPWTSDTVIYGGLQTSQKETIAEGFIIYDKIKSSITLKMMSSNDVSNLELSLDIPKLRQKVDTIVTVHTNDAYRSGGRINMTMNGRHISLTGQLLTKLAASSLGKQKESRFSFTLALPSEELPQISTNFMVTRPANHYGSMKINGSVKLGDEISVLSMSYDLPMFGNNLLGVSGFWKSNLNGPNDYELSLSSNGYNFQNFNSRVIYKLNQLNLDWKINFPRVNAAFRLVKEGQHFGVNEYELSTTGYFNISELLNVTVNAICKERTLSFHSFVKRESNRISSGVSINSPQLLGVPHNYRLNLRVEENQTHFLEMFGNQGQDTVEVIGEMHFKPNLLTANTKVTGSYGSHYGKIDFNRENNEYEVDLIIESTSLLWGKTVSVKGRVSPFANGFEATLQCRTRKSTHSVSMSTVLRSTEGLITFKTESPILKPITFHTEWKKQGLALSGVIKSEVFDTIHKMEAFLNMKNLEGRLSIASPLIPSSHFNFHLKAIVTTENIDILGDVNIRNSHWHLEGILQYNDLKEMTTKLEFLSPYDSFKRLTLAFKTSKDEVYVEIHTPFKLVPNAMLKVRGISAIQERNWKNMHPSVTIGLPIGTVSAFAIVKAPNATYPGLLHVFFEEGIFSSGNKYELHGEISPLSHFSLNMENTGMVYGKLVTPFLQYSLMEAKLDGRIEGKNLVKINAEGKLNEETSSFLFDYQNENNNPNVRTEIKSPFKNYEEIAFVISLDSFQKIGDGKSVHMEFESSAWEEPIRLDADYRYRYEGFLDVEGEVNTVVSFMDIPDFHADIKSGMKESQYTGSATGSLGSQALTMEIKSEMTEDNFTASFHVPSSVTEGQNHIMAFIILNRSENEFAFRKEIHIADEEILVVNAIFSSVSQSAGGEIKLNTFWGKFESHLTAIPTGLVVESPISFQQLFDNTNATFDATFDGWRIFGIQVVSRNGRKVLEVYNPIRPVSLMLYFDRSSSNQLKVTSEVCWNLENPIGNSVGIALLWNRGFSGHDFEIKIQGEKAGLLETKVSHSLTSSKFNQLVSMRWNSPLFKIRGESGYHIMLSRDSSMNQNNCDFLLQVDLPWRSGAIETHSNKSLKESQHTLTINWDLNRDDTKFISLKLHNEEKIAWRTKESSHFLEIVHPLSDQPAVFTLEQIFKDNRFQHMELDIKTSPEPQSNFVVLISRNNTDWKNFKAIVSHAPTKLYTEVHMKTVGENPSIEFSYMDRLGVVRDFTAEASLNPENLQIEIYSGASERKTVALKLQSVSQPDTNIINVQIFSMEAGILVQKSLPYLEAVVKHDGERRLRVSGGLPHKKEINLQVSGTEFGKSTNYLLVTIKLNNSNTLSTRVNWHPNFWTLMMELDIPAFMRSTISSDINIRDLCNKIREEIKGRWNSLSPVILETIKKAQTFVVAESTLIREEAVMVAVYFQNLYDTNTFYLKNAVDTFRSAFYTVTQICQTVTNGIVTIWNSAIKISIQGLAKLHDLHNKYEGKLESMIMELWDQTESFVNRLWRENLSLLSSLFDKLEYSVTAFLDVLEGRIDELEKKFMAVGLIRKTIQLYKEYATWIEEIPIQEYVQNVESMLSIKIWDHVAEYFRPIIDSIQKGLEDQYFKDLLETPPIPYIRFVAKQMNAGFIKFWEVIEVEQRVKSVVKASLKHIDGMIQRYVPASSLVYSLEEGSIDFDQSLSTLQWDDLTQLPRWKTSEEGAEDVNQLTNFYYQVLDKIESLKPILDMNIRSILPPFGSYALMAGDYHYFTFDKKYFRFAGECSYLLVADLSHTKDTFSLIVNYDNRDGTTRKKSYTISSDGKLIDVDIANFKVTVNGRKVELPLKVGSTYIRRHQTGLELYDVRGFQMSCSLSPSVCTLWASGWHFGKLAGLLGTYDNEQINDLRNPEDQIIPDVSTFAYSWRVGKNSGNCRMKNYARDDAESVDVDSICHNLLNNRSSPLRPCFNTVDTEIYFEMCKYDVFRNVNSANRAEAACHSMSAYVAECQKNNVDVWIPPTCVRCRLEDGTALTTGENATLEVNGERQPPKSSDNVIILQQGSCVSPLTISDAIAKLDLALNSQGIEDNRYAIVGFGGNGLHEKAHIKTTSARVWSHNTLFKIPNDTDASRLNGSDLYEAIQYAATLGFRAGVSKNIIAVTCGDSQCGDSKRYADILTLLLENDIKFHLIVPQAFTLKGNRKQEDDVLGIEINGAYTAKHAKSRTLEAADKSLLRQINIPKDFCTPLAIESNGTRFNFETPTKKLLDVWSQRVAATSHPSECQRCECVPDRYGSASLMCHQCVSPSLRRFMDEWDEWKAVQPPDGEELIPFDPLDHDGFIIT